MAVARDLQGAISAYTFSNYFIDKFHPSLVWSVSGSYSKWMDGSPMDRALNWGDCNDDNGSGRVVAAGGTVGGLLI